MTMTAERLDSGYRSEGVEGETYDVSDRGPHKVAVSIPHNKIDTYRTAFAPGAFGGSFQRRVPEGSLAMLGEHDPGNHLGRAVHAEVRSADNLIIGEFDQTPFANRWFDRIRSGEMKHWSFYFTNGEYVPHPSVRGAKTYVAADMHEFSSVARPSVPETATLGYRSQPGSDDLLAELEYGFDDVRYHMRELRRDGVIPFSLDEQIASTLARVRSRGAPVGSGRRSLDAELETRLFPRNGSGAHHA
jgi:phage head maturation protease